MNCELSKGMVVFVGDETDEIMWLCRMGGLSISYRCQD